MHVAAFATAVITARVVVEDSHPFLPPRQASTATSPASTSSTSSRTSTPSTSQTTTTSYLPLTTIFTPPASCADDSFGRQDTSNAFRDFSAANRACWPPGYTTRSFYSPGVCPSGFITASRDVNRAVTSVWCCYPGFGLAQYGADPQGSACSSFVNTAASVQGAGDRPQTLSNFNARQWPIQVMWARTDLTDFSPPSAPVLAPTISSTASPSVNVTVSGTATPSESSDPGSGGLSTGAKAGIGVGVSLGVLAVLLVIGFLVLRKKRRERSQFHPTTADVCYRYDKPEDDKSVGKGNSRHELPDTNVALLQAKSGPHYEMGADQEPSELEGSVPIPKR